MSCYLSVYTDTAKRRVWLAMHHHQPLCAPTTEALARAVLASAMAKCPSTEATRTWDGDLGAYLDTGEK